MTIALSTIQAKELKNQAIDRAKSGENAGFVVRRCKLDTARTLLTRDVFKFRVEDVFNTLLILDADPTQTSSPTLTLRFKKNDPNLVPYTVGVQIKIDDDVFDYLEVFNDAQAGREIILIFGFNTSYSQNLVKLANGSTVSIAVPNADGAVTPSLTLAAATTTIIAPSRVGTHLSRTTVIQPQADMIFGSTPALTDGPTLAAGDTYIYTDLAPLYGRITAGGVVKRFEIVKVI